MWLVKLADAGIEMVKNDRWHWLESQLCQVRAVYACGSKMMEGKFWCGDSGKPEWSVDRILRRIGANKRMTKNCP